MVSKARSITSNLLDEILHSKFIFGTFEIISCPKSSGDNSYWSHTCPSTRMYRTPLPGYILRPLKRQVWVLQYLNDKLRELAT